MAEMCGNCRNFSETRSLCRAYPPKARDDGTAIWPGVSRSDWCGEYRIAPPPENPGIRRLART